MKRQMWVLLGTLAVMAVLFSAALVTSGQGMSRVAQSAWTPVFTDTFTTNVPVWTITDDSAAGYEWGVAPYTLQGVPNQGLWAAGGGVEGGVQDWATGTYTYGMMTLAVAGPFTFTQSAVEVRLTARVLNASLAGDSLVVSLSEDGINPLSSDAVPVSGSTWQTVTQVIGPYDAGEAIWVFAYFHSGTSGLAKGPLLDDIRVDVRYQSAIYLPLMQVDPTPTPLPIFHDDFNDPTSGWHVGWAQRYNEYTDRYGVWHEGVEDVAEMLYANGTYQIHIPLTWHGWGDVDTWFVWPAEMAPLMPSAYPIPADYCIEMAGRIPKTYSPGPGLPLESPYLAHWGIVFGANEALSEIYTFQINSKGNLGIVGFHNYTYPGDRDYRVPTNQEWPMYRWPDTENHEFWSRETYGSPAGTYTTLKVHVHGTTADFYVNGVRLATAPIGGMPRDRVGLIGGDYEVTPATIEIDYFHYDPSCAP